MINMALRRMIGWIFPHDGSDYRDGLTIVAKATMQYRWLVASIFLFNVVAAVFEGSTIGILAIAASALVDQNVVNSGLQRFGELGFTLQSFLKDVGAGGLFLGLVSLAVVISPHQVVQFEC